MTTTTPDLVILPSLEVKTNTSVAITVPAGAIGATVSFSLGKTNIRNAKGNSIGSTSDTSLSFGVGVCTTEVTEDRFSKFAAAGDYWVDYYTGLVTVNKATTGTAETATFKTVLTEVSVETIDVTTSVATPTTFTSRSIAITSTATAVLAVDSTRKAVTILNEGSNAVRIGPAGVTYNGTVTTDGVLLTAGSAITLENTGALYAICASGLTATLSYFNSTI